MYVWGCRHVVLPFFGEITVERKEMESLLFTTADDLEEAYSKFQPQYPLSKLISQSHNYGDLFCMCVCVCDSTVVISILETSRAVSRLTSTESSLQYAPSHIFISPSSKCSLTFPIYMKHNTHTHTHSSTQN